MTPEHLTLEAVDRDGAIREAADRVAGDTRAGFIAKAAGATGALVGASALLASPASAQGSSLSATDKDILNFALTLEFLEAAFYADAIEKKAISGEALRFAQVAGAHENTHVETLQKVLGTDAVAKPGFDFKGTTSKRTSFLSTAVLLEDTGVMAYKGQAPRIVSREILVSALAIHAIEAKHAAWVRRIAGKTPVPFSVEPPKTKAQVLAAVTSTGFITRATYPKNA
jgi:hypothetical protein